MPAPRPRRIVIHPGFHKTGTSSMQHLFWTNRILLGQHLGVLQLRHLRPAAEVCMHFARHQSPLALTNLVEVMDAILAEHLPEDDHRDLLLSCEGLSGHLPGWPGVDSYVAAPITAAFLAGYFADRHPDADLQFVYTTRDPESWLYSAWRHHLHGQRLRLDFDAFSDAYGASSDLEGMVQEVAEAVDPVPVNLLPLEEAREHPQGPGAALLELFDLPDRVRSAIVPVGHGNAGPDADLAAEYLRLNLSDQTDQAVKIAKAKLAESNQHSGWAKG